MTLNGQIRNYDTNKEKCRNKQTDALPLNHITGRLCGFCGAYRSFGDKGAKKERDKGTLPSVRLLQDLRSLVVEVLQDDDEK